ncbi:MAG: 4-diphosphocytidyl-2-C-methyl-D-erythritol kinase [uncultured Nocardioidaceae bacterium]|uniref:4-diphosphocytidyl-2-C-methyl-D-erythritol kinase n=1 Tax=uncultured Nocardioidaceae bacterium TaxID=253824 RepID=A0A6J4M7J1_9ACTN|nr:MAG: 4-diphosphocytidyl-2-C-methyl-D-erythritol kinase [uncultured Nocardioidaceae bacterium]
MTAATARAPGKLNLALTVGPLQPSGFHPVATIYHAVDLCDDVRATPTTGTEITVEVTYEGPPPAEHLPLGEDNLAVRAATLLRDSAGVRAGVELHVRKAIPVAGGMAGGSADAAAALVACDAAWQLGTPRERLTELAGELGSDVPFSLHGGTALGTGRGEQLSPVLSSGTFLWVLAVAERGLSTPAVYAAYDGLAGAAAVRGPEPQVSPALMSALRAGNAVALGAALSNELQEAALWLRPELADTLAVGAECGALGSVVSGSGPTVAFLAADDEQALDLALALTGAGVCADVVQAIGPAAGTRLVG